MDRIQIRNPGEGRDYYERKRDEIRAPMGAPRCFKRRFFDIVSLDGCLVAAERDRCTITTRCAARWTRHDS